MGNISRNFSRSEFLCGCGCGAADPHPMLVAGLQQLCDLAQNAMTVPPVCHILSGTRCPARNRIVGGAPASKHLRLAHGYSEAADIRLVGWSLRDTLTLALEVERFAAGGVGAYLRQNGWWLHLDVRMGGPARWGDLYGESATIEAVLKAEDELRKESQP